MENEASAIGGALEKVADETMAFTVARVKGNGK